MKVFYRATQWLYRDSKEMYRIGFRDIAPIMENQMEHQVE